MQCKNLHCNEKRLRFLVYRVVITHQLFKCKKAVSAFRFGYLRIYSGVACAYYRPFKVRLIKFKVVSPTCSCLAICEIVDIMYLIFCSIMVGHITVHLCVKSRKHYNIIMCKTSPLPSLPW